MWNTRLEKEGCMNVASVNSASLPTVSVIVPAYNVEKYIGECVESLLAQTYPELEIIVVDDGSTDATASMLGRYERCGSVKVISQKNQGVSAARNRALAAARGKFVAFIDSDDVVHPELFATCVNLCNEKDGDFVLYDYEEFSSGQIPQFGQISSERIEFIDRPLSYYLDNGFKGGMSAMFVRRELLDGLEFVPGVSKGEDMCFSFSLLPRLKKGWHIRVPLYFYRRTEGSLDSGSLSLKDVSGFAEILRNLNRLYSSLDGRSYDTVRRRWFPKVIKNIVKRGVRLASTDDAAEMESLIASLMNDGTVGYAGFTWRWRWYLWRMRRKCKMRRRA
jgi:glycosyltransferase involved in cell wall biosynthesis